MRPHHLLLACIPCFMGCEPSGGDHVEQAGWSSLPNAYATHFEVQVRGDERRLLVFGAEGRADTVGRYLYRGEGEMLPVPVQRAVVLSTTHLSYFGSLGAVDQVVGTAFTAQVRDPRFVEAARDGRLQEVSRADGIDRERLLALAPQVIFDYPFGMGDRRTTSLANTVHVTEYLEEHPLGRAEWIRFFGMLLGREQRADSIFNAIMHRYSFLCDLRAHLPKEPSVFFGSHWEGAWSAPAGNSCMAALIRDAGGRYVFADSAAPGNIAVPLERLLIMGDTVDHIGVLLAHAGPVDRRAMVGGDPRIARLKGVREGAFVGNSATRDLFGQALLEPDEMLRDLRCILHPGTCAGRKARYFEALRQ
ncbi:MAG: ABC transporter substrate-binding protein [Flavobacteriales bacterium]|nr:ABC transporter substrate-binding protein [Flavobacteriales bacterium]